MKGEYVKGSVARRILEDRFEKVDGYIEGGDSVILSEIRICDTDNGTRVTAVREETISLRDASDPYCVYYILRENDDPDFIPRTSECGYFRILDGRLVLAQSDFGENLREIDSFTIQEDE